MELDADVPPDRAPRLLGREESGVLVTSVGNGSPACTQFCRRNSIGSRCKA